jgi:hypothetical protein
MDNVWYDPEGQPITYTVDTNSLPAGLQYLDTPPRIEGVPTTVNGTPYSFTITAFDSIQSNDWEARAGAAGVVWAHDFEYEDELWKHLNPADNADLGNDVTTVSPKQIRPYIENDNGATCLTIPQLGGTTVQTIATQPGLTTYDWPTASITTSSNSRAEFVFPIDAAALGIVTSLSTFRIVSGSGGQICGNENTYFDVPAATLETPGYVIVDDVNQVVRVGVRYSNFVNVVNWSGGLRIQHVKVQDTSIPPQEIWIDEKVDEIGQGLFPDGWVHPGETWPYPQGYNSLNPSVVLPTAHTVVIQYEYDLNGEPARLKDKVTVLQKFFDNTEGSPTYKKTRLTIRRASMGMGDAGRQENQIINRFFPCEIPAGAVIGRDVTGGWTRPLCPLRPGENGKPVDQPDPGAPLTPGGPATLPIRQLYNGTTKVASFRTGYYGHQDYHGLWPTLAERFTPNTIQQNGVNPFNDNEFYLAFTMKYSPTIVNRVDSTKLFFLDQYQTPDDSQIVGSSYKIGRPEWDWFHNYGSYMNSLLPNTTWLPPINEWFAVRIHIIAGHDNDMEYTYAQSGSVITNVVQKVNDAGQELLVIECTNFALKAGMTRNLDGTADPVVGLLGLYPQSPQNPQGKDPTISGYFDGWKVSIQQSTVTNLPEYGEFIVQSHVVNGATTTFTLTKKQTWPAGLPLVGWKVKAGWNAKENAKYYDTFIELHKKEASDSDWVLVSSFNWPITFNGGVSTTSAGNPPGWSNFQPTGYANIDDNNPPATHSIWTRFRQCILSHEPIAAPAL